MKPPPFVYEVGRSVDEALAALARYGDEASVLAGGQSLVPMMSFRLAQPSALIDINAARELAHIDETDGALRLGALVRHEDLEQPVTTDPLGGLLAEVAPFVGHVPVRSRGTFGGSLAHADPAAEWCLLTRALDGDLVATSEGSHRTIAAGSFFRGPFTTALEPGELLTEVRLPLLGAGTRTAFVECARRAGDFAVVAVVAAARVADGIVERVHLGLGGVDATPIKPHTVEAMLAGERPSRALVDEAAAAVARDLDPPADVHGSSAYRKDLVTALTRDALSRTCLEPHEAA